MQSFTLLQNLKINTTTYFLVYLLQVMRLTFRIMSRGKARGEPGTILRSNTTNHFLFSICNHVRPQATKGPDHNKTRAQGSRISLGPEWTCVNACWSPGRMDAHRPDKASYKPTSETCSMWNRPRRAPQAEKFPSGQCQFQTTRLICAIINHTVKA